MSIIVNGGCLEDVGNLTKVARKQSPKVKLRYKSEGM
jgi:hypothetical protein